MNGRGMWAREVDSQEQNTGTSAVREDKERNLLLHKIHSRMFSNLFSPSAFEIQDSTKPHLHTQLRHPNPIPNRPHTAGANLARMQMPTTCSRWRIIRTTCSNHTAHSLNNTATTCSSHKAHSLHSTRTTCSPQTLQHVMINKCRTVQWQTHPTPWNSSLFLHPTCALYHARIIPQSRLRMLMSRLYRPQTLSLHSIHTMDSTRTHHFASAIEPMLMSFTQHRMLNTSQQNLQTRTLTGILNCLCLAIQ